MKPSRDAAECSPNAAATLKSFATDVSGLVKSIDPNHLVSLGTIGGGQCGAQGAEYQDVHAVPTIDLCEYHDYQPNDPMPGDQWNGLQVRLDQCNALHKPLFVGETGIKPSDVGGTLRARADALRAKLDAQFSAGHRRRSGVGMGSRTARRSTTTTSGRATRCCRCSGGTDFRKG